MTLNLKPLDAMAAGLWAAFNADRSNAAARLGLAEIYLPLARRAAMRESYGSRGRRHNCVNGCDSDDLSQLGFFVLLHLVDRFDDAKSGGSFVLYASARLTLGIHAAARELGYFGRRGSCIAHQCQMSLADLVVSELPDDDAGRGLDLADADFLEMLAAQLGPWRWRLFERRFVKGMTNEQLGVELGRSASSVSLYFSNDVMPMLEKILCDQVAPGLSNRLRKLGCSMGHSGSKHRRTAA